MNKTVFDIEAIRWRDQKENGSGIKLFYVSAETIKQKLIEKFDDKFSFELIELSKVSETNFDNKFNIGYICRARITIINEAGLKRSIEDVGFGNQIAKDLGKCYEGATKEAVSDALKRCATHLGNEFGLCLYDKNFLATLEPISGNKVRLKKTSSTSVVKEVVNVEVVNNENMATEKQINFIKRLDKDNKKSINFNTLTTKDASALINELKSLT